MTIDELLALDDTELDNLIQMALTEQNTRKTLKQEEAFQHFLTAFQECVNAGMKIKYSDEDDEYYSALNEDGFFYE